MNAHEELAQEISRANLNKGLWPACQSMLRRMTDEQKAGALAHIHMKQLNQTYAREDIPNIIYNSLYNIEYNWEKHKWGVRY